jgi:creatinine amidohydrolase/Fe(II)-dependent formamide hydrolase-like protein
LEAVGEHPHTQKKKTLHVTPPCDFTLTTHNIYAGFPGKLTVDKDAATKVKMEPKASAKEVNPKNPEVINRHQSRIAAINLGSVFLLVAL